MRKLRRIAIALVLAACGSRTGLLVGESGLEAEEDGGNIDAGHKDGTVADGDAAIIDDVIPPLDVQPNPDVVRNDCPDADATLVYVLTEENELYSFFPTDGTFTLIGTIACPTKLQDLLDPSKAPTPFSMAVNRKGIAYTVFSSGELFRVSTVTAACVPTNYQPQGDTFGMSFTTDLLGPTESLYVATDVTGGTGVSELESIDTTKFGLSVVGAFNPQINSAELAGTGDGRLFGFYPQPTDPTDPNAPPAPSYVIEIDKTNGNIIGQTLLPDVTQGDAWAFGYWGGDFYMFTDPSMSGNSLVQRYRPSDGTTTSITSLPRRIVGAGVSTCAPQQ